MDAKIRELIIGSQSRGLSSPSRMLNLYHLLTQVLFKGAGGAVVEIGSYEGGTAVLLRAVMDYCLIDADLHVYDSFQGLSSPTVEDGLDADSLQGRFTLNGDLGPLLKSFQSSKLSPPIVHCGLVEQILPKELPSAICFAHVDVDWYAPTIHSLRSLIPHMAPGGVLVVDDFGHPGFPGVMAAVREVFADCFLDFNLVLAGLVEQYQAVAWF